MTPAHQAHNDSNRNPGGNPPTLLKKEKTLPSLRQHHRGPERVSQDFTVYAGKRAEVAAGGRHQVGPDQLGPWEEESCTLRIYTLVHISTSIPSAGRSGEPWVFCAIPRGLLRGRLSPPPRLLPSHRKLVVRGRP